MSTDDDEMKMTQAMQTMLLMTVDDDNAINQGSVSDNDDENIPKDLLDMTEDYADGEGKWEKADEKGGSDDENDDDDEDGDEDQDGEEEGEEGVFWFFKDED